MRQRRSGALRSGPTFSASCFWPWRSMSWWWSTAAPIRYAILSALQKSDRVSYTTLLAALGISTSLLSKHIAVLESSGYVAIHKVHGGCSMITELESTPHGAECFTRHQDMMLTIGRSIVEDQ